MEEVREKGRATEHEKGKRGKVEGHHITGVILALLTQTIKDSGKHSAWWRYYQKLESGANSKVQSPNHEGFRVENL